MSDLQTLDLNNDGILDADLNRDGVVTAKEAELYRKHVVYYFDTQLQNDILNLSPEDKSRFFQMMTDYADIWEKIFHPGVDIIEHILGKRFAAAKSNPHEGINWEYECPIIREYDEWKANKK